MRLLESSAHRLGLLFVVAGTGIFESSSSRAQEPLAEVTVRATAMASGLTAETAAQARDRIGGETAGGAGVVDAADLQKRSLNKMEDALRGQPGLAVETQFSGTSQARFVMRGSGVAGTPPTRGVRLLVDDMPMTLPDGHFLPQNIDTRAVDHIEVYRGAASISRNIGSLGGTINFATPTGRSAPHFYGRVEGGSFETWREHLAAAYAAENADLYVSGTMGSQNGFQFRTGEEAWFANANFGIRLADPLETRFYFLGSEIDGELAGTISKRLCDFDPTAVNPVGVAPNVRVDLPFRDIMVNRVGNRTVWRQDDHEIEAAVWWLYSDYRAFRPRATEGLDFVSNATGGDLDYRFDGDIGGAKDTFEFGLHPYVEWRDMRRIQLNFGEPGLLQSDHDVDTGFYAATLENRLWLTRRLSLVTALQAVHHYRDIQENYNLATQPPVPGKVPPPGSVAPPAQRFFHYDALNPKAALMYEFTDDILAFAAISRTYEPPLADDLLGSAARQGRLVGAKITQLRAQNAVTVEAGTRGKAGPVHWDVTWYRSWIEDELIRTRPPAGPDVTLNSETGTIHHGVELALDATLAEGLFADGAEVGERDRVDFRLAYTWSECYFDEDPLYFQNEIPAIPPHLFVADMTYSHPCGFYVGVSADWMPEPYPVDYANTLHTDPYVLCGVRAGYQRPRGVSVFVDLSNVFDQECISGVSPLSGLDGTVTPDTPALFPGPGFAVRAGLEVRF
ncbi:MAG: TonB-dependent receptor [Verrucomicrobiae bacterium]|nr:TonB-dependent receptor [Verrucomicrobiae bacterium]